MARLGFRDRLRVPTYGDPEQIQPGEVAFDRDKCSGCGICAQACPADVLIFGDLNDPNSRVAKLAKDRRQYRLLEELGTEPSVIYLKKVDPHATEEPATH